MERMCALAGVSRSGYYRHWQASRPRQEETALRDRLQRLALAHRHYGYRRLTALLKREGWVINHKRVLRLAREDNLLCLRRRAFVPATTQSNHRHKIWPNLARRIEPTAPDQLWVADITYIRLDEAGPTEQPSSRRAATLGMPSSLKSAGSGACAFSPGSEKSFRRLDGITGRFSGFLINEYDCKAGWPSLLSMAVILA